MCRSTTSIPSAGARVSSSVVRVMDSRMSLVSGGVTSWPRRTMKNVAPEPSATVPCWFRKIGAS
jgi:hypothetical protein